MTDNPIQILIDGTPIDDLSVPFDPADLPNALIEVWEGENLLAAFTQGAFTNLSPGTPDNELRAAISAALTPGGN